MKNKIPQSESVPVPVRTQGGVRKKLRRRSAEEKRWIVEETLAPGASVAVVARRHDVNANQVFMWRRAYRAGKLGNVTAVAGFIPVGVVDENAVIRPALPVPAATERRRRGKNVPASTTSCWLSEVELCNGIKVRFGAGVGEKDMRSVLVLVRELA